jgi:class 3 adenylate cyclase
MSTALPSGTVTFVFTDIEGSTKLLQELGDEYADVSRDHRRIVREAFGAHDGTEIDTQGDSFFFSFTRARDAAAAAVEAQRALEAHAWPQGTSVRVRMGLHTGEPTVGDEGYLGLDVVRAARISAAGHGGQILLSETTRALLGNQLPENVSIHDLGRRELKDIQHEQLYELALDGRPAVTEPLRTDAVDSRTDAMAKRFEDRVTTYVEQQLEAAFKGGGPGPSKPPEVPVALAAKGLGIAGLSLLMLVVVVVLAALLVKVVFF